MIPYEEIFENEIKIVGDMLILTEEEIENDGMMDEDVDIGDTVVGQEMDLENRKTESTRKTKTAMKAGVREIDTNSYRAKIQIGMTKFF